VVELVDTPDLGSGDASRGGSSPFVRTTLRLRLRVAYATWRKSHEGGLRRNNVSRSFGEGELDLF